MRSQFPLDLVTLDLVPTKATMPAKGTIAWRISLVRANAFEVSPTHPLGAALEEAGFAPLRWDYLVDAETTRLAVGADFQVSERWSFGFELPVISHSGGHLDSTIEDFHDVFGLPQNGRDLFPRDSVNIDLLSPAGRKRLDRSESAPGDLTVHARVRVAGGARSAWAVAFDAKAPTGDAKSFTGSGSWDGGLALLFSGGSSRHVFHGGLGHQVLGQPTDWPFETDDRTSAFAGWEFMPAERWSILAQVSAATSILPGGNEKQHRPRAELMLGFHWVTGRFRLSSGFMENILTNDNDTDLAAMFELGWEFRR